MIAIDYNSLPVLIRETYSHVSWHHKFQNLLVSGLKNNRGYVPTDWIKAVAEFDRDDAKEVLIEYFKYGWNNHITYKTIASLIGIEERVRRAIPITWETAGQSNKYALGDLTPKFLELGYRPAFKFVMASLADNANQPKHSFNALNLARRYTDQTGGVAEISNWYRNNRSKIQFDTLEKIFVSG